MLMIDSIVQTENALVVFYFTSAMMSVFPHSLMYVYIKLREMRNSCTTMTLNMCNC